MKGSPPLSESPPLSVHAQTHELMPLYGDPAFDTKPNPSPFGMPGQCYVLRLRTGLASGCSVF